jgi:hypothetical protein
MVHMSVAFDTRGLPIGAVRDAVGLSKEEFDIAFNELVEKEAVFDYENPPAGEIVQ